MSFRLPLAGGKPELVVEDERLQSYAIGGDRIYWAKNASGPPVRVYAMKVAS